MFCSKKNEKIMYDPKLRQAMAEITEILKKYDVGALVSLHSMEATEFRMQLEPSWSMIRWVKENEKMHIKIRRKEPEKMNATAGMVCSMRDLSAMWFSHIDKIIKQIEQHSKIDHTPFGGGIDNSGREETPGSITRIF